MLSTDFLQAYPRELPPEKITRGTEFPVLSEFRHYSHGYGLLAHAALRGEREHMGDLLAPLATYERTNSYNDVEPAVLELPNGWDYRNEISFYELNESMRGLWAPLVEGAWPSQEMSEQTMTTAMNALAVQGLIGFAIREKFIEVYKGTELLYTPENKKCVDAITGSLQEVDVAIVAMGIARKMARTNPGITVVPAPMQFENKSGSANVDLLFIDMQNERTVGIQTKTSVSGKTLQRYDHDRVVLVDGSIDLGNVRVVRTERRRSTERVKPWPGIIAASRVHAIEPHGKQSKNIPPFLRRENLMSLKHMARELVGTLRVNPSNLELAIKDRIIDKL